MKSTVNMPIAVIVANRSDLEHRLEEAVSTVRARASIVGRQGILVTRHDYGSFTVALSDAVPFGLTYEHEDWVANRKRS